MTRPRSGTGPRLVVVATKCYPHIGGIESHVENVLKRIDPTPWHVEVVATDGATRDVQAVDTSQGYPVNRYRGFPRNRDWFFSPGLFFDVLLRRRSLVHIHGVNALVPPVAMAAAILGRRPFIVTLHSGGASTDLRSRMRPLQWRLLGLLLRHATRIIAVSQYEKERFAPLVAGRPIEVIPNGSSDLTLPADVEVDPDLIVSVGRLESYKGHQKVIEALSVLRRTRPNAHLRILGSGPYESELHIAVKELGLDAAVTITAVPPKDREQMAREMGSAAVITLMSDYEAHPVAVLEALSLHRPVVARRNSGFIELVDEGLIVGIADDAGTEEIAQAIGDVMAAALAPQVELPSWDDCVSRLQEVYAELLPGRLSA